MPDSVQVLLSTYNGARYLPELLASLTRQTYPNIDVLVRDDGSTDGTPTIMESWRGLPVQVSCEEHVGVPASYFRLLSRSSSTSGYFALCDQDDVWLDDKVARAVESLATVPAGVPALYCGRARLVDAALRPLAMTRRLDRRPSLSNALVENIATGCTIVLNRQARDLIVSHVPRHALMHDWWCYLVVAAFGRVIHVDDARVDYRQHDHNVVGYNRGLWLRLKRIVRGHGCWPVPLQAAEFLMAFGSRLEMPQRTLVEEFLASFQRPLGRLRYAAAPAVQRQSRADQLLLRVMLVAGRVPSLLP